MQLISKVSQRDLAYLEIPVLQAIINFKWHAYTKRFFVRQFLKTLLFIGSLIADIIFVSPRGFDPSDTGPYMRAQIVTRVICLMYIADFTKQEVKQLLAEGTKHYGLNFWNICDIMLVTTYVIYVPLSFSLDSTQYVVKVFQCLILIFTCIKFNFYLRIFDRFSYLVQMIQRVFYDLQYFILFYIIIIATFSIMVSLIMNDTSSSDADSIGPTVFFVNTLRTSLGDSGLDEADSNYKILFWLIYLLVMFVGNIVLMNFIIAVVGESYDKCSQTMVA
jgi:Ion transport protein